MPGQKFYELIEHTADIGIRVKADTLKGLFKNAALAMFDIIAEKKNLKVKHTQSIKIKQKADDLEEIFIYWLNELLSLSATKEVIFSDFKIDKLDQNNLQAVVLGVKMTDYKVNTEIKAATYYELKLQENKSGWIAEVIFDV
jgi:SHS2 domain-containing protein